MRNAAMCRHRRRKMKFWFDTEFHEDGRTIDLISIGVVAEDGREYYAETDFAAEKAGYTDWLKANVQPHLSRGGEAERSRQIIRRELVEFMGDAPEIWAYYADYDWVALCQLHGTMMDLPKGWPMYCRDLKQLVDQCGNPHLPAQTTTEHHALADAIWTKDTWLWLRDRQRAIDAAA
jgi:hypothetical protein